jgi:hypothetical protein
LRDGDAPSRVGDDLARDGDVSLCAGDASHARRDVSLLETCVPPSAGDAQFRVGGVSSTARDACHELTCGSDEETWGSYDVGDEPLRDGDAPLRVGDASLCAGDASHGLTGVCLLEICVLLSAGGASRRAGGVLFAQG